MKRCFCLHKNLFFAGKRFVLHGLLFLCFIFYTLPSRAVLSYTESNLSIAFAYNSSPTSIPELYQGCDEVISNPYPIGFTFNYGGVNYTQFVISSNGWMSFNTSCFYMDGVNLLAGSASQTANNERPIIAPLWDDLDVSYYAAN